MKDKFLQQLRNFIDSNTANKFKVVVQGKKNKKIKIAKIKP